MKKIDNNNFYNRIIDSIIKMSLLDSINKNKIAVIRLNKERKKLTDNEKIEGITIEVTDDIYVWYAYINGPKDTPYENFTFKLKITCSDDYPIKPPSIKFLTPMCHPNIYRDGKICLDIIQLEGWSPSLNIKSILMSICSLLDDPNPASPANRPIAELYLKDKKEYNAHVIKFNTENKDILL